MYRTGIGQDSHRFLPQKGHKKCVIGGLQFDEVPGLDADSDGDVVLHAICNAISSITHIYILGEVAPKMCKEENITDSSFYLEKALNSLHNQRITHVAITIEALKPRLQKHLVKMRKNVAKLLNINELDVGITCTSGDQLSDFAKGYGLQAFAVVTTVDEA